MFLKKFIIKTRKELRNFFLKMEDKKMTKKQIIKSSIYIILGTIAFVFIVLMVITKGNLFSAEGSEEYLNVLLKVILGFIVFICLIGFLVYKLKNKKLIRILGSRKGKRIISIFTVLFGVYLVLTGVRYFTGPAEIETNIILVRVGFGVVTIIWGIYNLKKNKSKLEQKGNEKDKQK